MSTITYTEQLTVIYCANCSVPFGIPPDMEARRRDDHATFYCPAGHHNVYNGKTDAEKERARADRLQKQVEQREADLRFEQRRLDNERRAHAATKGVLTKTKNRIAAGTCPCCKRNFVNLGRHMSGQHPDYAEVAAK